MGQRQPQQQETRQEHGTAPVASSTTAEQTTAPLQVAAFPEAAKRTVEQSSARRGQKADRPDINEWLKEQVSVAEAKANSARPHDSAQQSLGTMHCEQTHVGYKNIQCNLWINTLASSLLSFV